MLLSSHPSLVAVALVPKTQLYTTLWYCLNLPLVLSAYLQETEKMFTRFAAFFLSQRKLLFCSFLIKLFSMLSFSKNPWVCQMISLSHTLLISLFFVFTLSLSLSLSLSLWMVSLSISCLSFCIHLYLCQSPACFIQQKLFPIFQFYFYALFLWIFFWMFIDFTSFISLQLFWILCLTFYFLLFHTKYI